MTRVVVLDAGPLGYAVYPKGSTTATECYHWLENLLAHGAVVAIPEIADYENRRALLRHNNTAALTQLNALKATLVYLPITTAAMLKAAELWAETRRQGRPTADDKALDGDMILVAQTLLLTQVDQLVVDETVIATTNVTHLNLFANAQHWQDISPV